MRTLIAVGLAALLGCVSPAARAAEFQLYPLRLTLSVAMPIAAFKLMNTGDTPARLQASLARWTQGADGDEFASSRDVLMNPPLFAVPAKGVQTVRVGLGDTAKPGDTELAYRAFFQEVPGQAKQNGGIQTLLRVSVPIFIPPRDPQPIVLQCRVVASPESGQALEIRNVANQHVQITKLTLKGGGGTILSKGMSLYVLPGATMVWRPEKKTTSWPEGLHVVAESDQGPIEADTESAHASPAGTR